MRSYDNPQIESYSFGEHDFGAGGDSLAVNGPAKMRGRLLDIIVSATETFTNDTTEGKVQVGTAADVDAYAEMGLGTLADTNSVRASDASGDLIEQDIPADTQVEITFVAPTGGTPAGKGHVTVVIGWYGG